VGLHPSGTVASRERPHEAAPVGCHPAQVARNLHDS
jgi:hypothetical protein